MTTQQNQPFVEVVDTVIVGGGQAGLALGWHLARQGRDFVILDAAPAGRRCLAAAVGLAAPVHPGQVRRPSGDAVPRGPPGLPDQGRDGRLP